MVSTMFRTATCEADVQVAIEHARKVRIRGNGALRDKNLRQMADEARKRFEHRAQVQTLPVGSKPKVLPRTWGLYNLVHLSISGPLYTSTSWVQAMLSQDAARQVKLTFVSGAVVELSKAAFDDLVSGARAFTRLWPQGRRHLLKLA